MSIPNRLANALSLLFTVIPDVAYPVPATNLPLKKYPYPLYIFKNLKTQAPGMRKVSAETRSVYCINTDFLRNLGFEKNETLSSATEWVYRYYCRVKGCYGIELVFSKEYSILSVEEFWVDKTEDSAYITNSIVGKFKLCSDEDLNFIFSRNIKLNYIFNVDGKRV